MKNTAIFEIPVVRHEDDQVASGGASAAVKVRLRMDTLLGFALTPGDLCSCVDERRSGESSPFLSPPPQHIRPAGYI